MKLSKTARVAWLNIFRGILLAATLELPWPRSLNWLWTAVNWGSAVMVIGGAATLMVYGLLNAWWLCEWACTDDPPHEPQRSLADDRVPVGVRQDGEMVYVRAGALAENRFSTLRYMGPPPVYVPAPAVVHRDATWVFPGRKPAWLGHGCLLRDAAPCAGAGSTGTCTAPATGAGSDTPEGG